MLELSEAAGVDPSRSPRCISFQHGFSAYVYPEQAIKAVFWREDDLLTS
jgi:hypothetical protein